MKTGCFRNYWVAVAVALAVPAVMRGEDFARWVDPFRRRIGVRDVFGCYAIGYGTSLNLGARLTNFKFAPDRWSVFGRRIGKFQIRARKKATGLLTLDGQCGIFHPCFEKIKEVI